MSPDTITAIQKALQPIADKIGQGAQYGWEVVVKQQYITGIVGIFDFVACFVLLIIFFTIAIVNAKKADWEGEGDLNIVCTFIFGGLAFIAALLCLTNWPDTSIQHLLNPDYYALQFFIGLVHPTN